MPCGSLRSAFRPSAMLRRAPCLAASTRYDRHRILPSWRRRTIGTLRAEGQMRPIPALQRFSRRELIPPSRPRGSRTRRAPEWSKRRRFGNPYCLAMFIRTKHHLGIRLRSAIIIPGIRHLPLSAIAKPALFWQKPAVSASWQGFPKPASAVNGMRQGSAHLVSLRAAPNRRAHASPPMADARTAAKQGGTKQEDIPRKTERLLLRPVRTQNLASLYEEPALPSRSPPCTPITFEAAELATITCQQAHPASEQHPRLMPPAASLR